MSRERATSCADSGKWLGKIAHRCDVVIFSHTIRLLSIKRSGKANIVPSDTILLAGPARYISLMVLFVSNPLLHRSVRPFCSVHIPSKAIV
jgi:hypothetical protein